MRSRRNSPNRVVVLLLAACCAVVALAARKALRTGRTSEREARSISRDQRETARNPPSGSGAALFTDVTRAAGVDFVHVVGPSRRFQLPEEMGSGGALFDFDNDGDMDLYLVQSGFLDREDPAHRNRLYRNDGNGRFTDVSHGSGADIGGYGMGCAAADFDNDGDVDLLVTRFGGCVLLRNDGGGRFEDMTDSSGLKVSGWPVSTAFVDFDRDGHLDMYIVRYIEWTPAIESPCYAPSGARDYCGPTSYRGPTSDLLYRNLGDGRFEDVSVTSGIASAKGNGLGVLVTDFDGDGWVDLYVANDQTPAFLWMNQRNGTFVERAVQVGAAYSNDGLAIAGMGVAAEDLDDDGDHDLLVSNIRHQSHLCLRNDGGQFHDVSQAWGFGSWSVPSTGFGLALFDQDHDGRLDGMVANGAVSIWGVPFREGHPYAEPNQFFRRDEAGRFHDATIEAGAAVAFADVSRALLTGDYDNDGDIDVVMTNNGGPVQLLRNENRSKHSWILLDLIPTGGGRNALNARVEVTAGGKTYRRECRPHSGYLGSNDPRVHVGLGAAKRIDRLLVAWPNGAKEEWLDLAVNRLTRVRQGTGRAAGSIVSATP